MKVLIAAAGTGGHVFPGLSVGEALVSLGVARDDVMFVGGSRLEAEVYPSEGFPFLQVELRGLQRSLTTKNLLIPGAVLRARKHIEEAIEDSGVEVVLGMGGYVTIPAGLAARRTEVPFFNAEQNAHAGLANRVSARWAVKSFSAFPDTKGLPHASWVGNPVRRPFWDFDRSILRDKGLLHYGIESEIPVMGVFGGSLGAAALNDAVIGIAENWTGSPLQIVHLTGPGHLGGLEHRSAAPEVNWVRIGFEVSMELFFAVSDLVLARAGGAVAELTATSTPSILVPGRFGSSGHQEENARFLTESGAAVTVPQNDLGALRVTVEETIFDDAKLDEMRNSARAIARPEAAVTIARELLEAA
ncbi:MAG: UDP-N-acetylglucosamine--N-acetylmuramyl-(pentapeptide) pyrophosphoryl-undecaprenol N-acetylglucosamine transferase [Acidimicrobiia bacterium]